MSNESLFTSFLGRGWSFPPTFVKGKQGVNMVDDETDIDQSLHILLSTTLGERTMLPDYGCNLDRLQFEPISASLKTYISGLVKDAILRYEPRIKLESIGVDSSGELEGVVEITLEYTVRATNTRNNYVYPFYKEEGTSIS